MTTTIIIPSLIDANNLKNCFPALKKQSVLPNEVIIIFKNLLPEIERIINDAPFCVKKIKVKKTESMSSILNYAIKLTTSDIIIFIDDDVVPENDWLYKIIDWYKKDKYIGGVGGMDEIYRFDKKQKQKIVKTVGKLTWFGRIIGNHHELINGAQYVDFLKGCNMSFKKDFILFYENLPGFYRWELPMCFNTKNKGYKIIYDPEIKVKHIKNKENKLTAKQFFTISHNTTYILLKELNFFRKIIFLLYTFLIGQRNNLGILKTVLLFFSSAKIIDSAFASFYGKIKGIKTYFNHP